jgi:amino acid transporter
MSQASAGAVRRRPIKVRGGSLGPFLCWAVVFADIGTSIYYVPGILYSQGLGRRAALFVGATLVLFVLLVLKYVEVTWRYPEGGGVVTVATRALHPAIGLLGGLFIEVDYFLTAAISALSGFLYISVLMPALAPLALPLTVGALVILGFLNYIGIKESAVVSAVVATAAGGFQLVVVVVTAFALGPTGIVHSFDALRAGPPLTPIAGVTGFAGAVLAFSGLESISQLSPAMAEPRNRIAPRAMLLVVATMAVTSPLLTLWDTTLVTVNDQTNQQLLSVLGTHVGGQVVGDAVAISGSVLLIFASNTAIIGSYHVLLALSRMGFLPGFMHSLNRWRGTPHWAILVTVAIPIAVLVFANGSINLLGDLYAFGLLGAFAITCFSLDVVRWYDRPRRRTLLAKAGYWLGVFTTVVVAGAWCVNLVNKPLATYFGGGVVIVGLVISLVNVRIGQQRGRPLVLPMLLAPNRDIVPIRVARQLQPAPVAAILPHDSERLDPVIKAAIRAADGRPITFLYHGHRHASHAGRLLEVRDPYLDDRKAQRAFARAEILARTSVRDRRYAYVPGDLSLPAVEEMIRSVDAHDVVVAEGDQGRLPAMALARVRVAYEDSVPVLHLMSGRPAHLQSTSSA